MTKVMHVFCIVLGRYICIGAVIKWPFMEIKFCTYMQCNYRIPEIIYFTN